MTRVVITGTGAVSAFGIGTAALRNGLEGARTALAPVEELAALGMAATRGGAVPICGEDGDQNLARTAIDEALAEATLPAERCALYWAAGLDTFYSRGDDMVHRSAGSCFRALAGDFARPRRMIALACASGTAALGEAFEAVRSGAVARAVAGGSSVMLTPFYVTGFTALGALAIDGDDPPCRPFDRTRRGFSLADGAGGLVVESLDDALERGATPLAEVLGYGTSQDAFDMNRPPEDGAGAERCIRAALGDAGLAPGDIAAVCAHGTGTLVGDLAEAAAIERALIEPPVFGIKGAIGHAMAAAGALEAIACVWAISDGETFATVGCTRRDPALGIRVATAREPLVSGPIISTSFGMGGQNAAVIIGRYE